MQILRVCKSASWWRCSTLPVAISDLHRSRCLSTAGCACGNGISTPSIWKFSPTNSFTASVNLSRRVTIPFTLATPTEKHLQMTSEIEMQQIHWDIQILLVGENFRRNNMRKAIICFVRDYVEPIHMVRKVNQWRSRYLRQRRAVTKRRWQHCWCSGRMWGFNDLNVENIFTYWLWKTSCPGNLGPISVHGRGMHAPILHPSA